MRRLAAAGLLAVSFVFSAPIGSFAASGAGFYGSTGGIPLAAPMVGMAATPSGNGYWLVASDGGVFAFGDAKFFGSTGAIRLQRPIVGITPTLTGNGYWLVASDGGVFAFGDAQFFGSTGAISLNKPIVASVITPNANGYWLVASDGGVFAFGNAAFYGSTGNISLNKPIVAALATSGGYRLIASDGGVFSFGNAAFHGSLGNISLRLPIVGAAATPNGYWMVASDGGVFAFGDAQFYGSLGEFILRDPIVGMAATPADDGYWLLASDGGVFALPDANIKLPQYPPTVSVITYVSGLSYPWDLGFTTDGILMFTERSGNIKALIGNSVRTLADPSDVRTGGEGGMMGLAIDPNFSSNRRIYVCFSSNNGPDNRVVRFVVNSDYTALTSRTDIITGMPYNTGSNGRHSGCRPRFAADGYMWIGTGDAATGTNAQNLNSLGGKVLRVDTDGNAAPGNLSGRIWSYGHRNVQGIAIKPGTSSGYSLEHGPDRDDEMNALVAGNFGWNPVPGYNESVPMTDLAEFPSAVSAIWSSGSPTVAPSGATYLSGSQWKGWNGAIAVGMLKGRSLRIFTFDSNGGLSTQYSIMDGGDRLRSPVQGPDGNLYIATDEDAGRILQVKPA